MRRWCRVKGCWGKHVEAQWKDDEWRQVVHTMCVTVHA